MEKEVSIQERVNAFIQGKDPMERIVSIECGWNDEVVSIIYNKENGVKYLKKDNFKPFVFAKKSVARRMFGGDRKEIQKELKKWGISCSGLKTKLKDDQEIDDRLANGYTVLFQAKLPMSWRRFNMFFQEAGTPLRPKRKKGQEIDRSQETREFLSVTPVEQYMMYTGKRLFKGYEGYDEMKRFCFDLETTGLDGRVDTIDQIGMRSNKGFEEVFDVFGDTLEEKKKNEIKGIKRMLEVLRDEKPDVIVGHNSENFDWNFIIERCIASGTTLDELSEEIIGIPIKKKTTESVLKLGGEMEKYYPTLMWGNNIIDSLHAVRRAQAIDSSMKSANLKYVTKYLNLKKQNRVYVKGSEISTIWHEFDDVYAFNDTDGSYYKITEDKPLQDGYKRKSGKYVVQRYLLDDLWETDKVELKLNEANFLVSKILCTSFSRACTMGTAGIWKLIILAWCYENKLAVPAFGESKRFTGGLSRLLKVGYAPNVVKLDYNSLYPSIILTWGIKSKLDVSDAMLNLLDYVLSQREKYKQLKKKAGKNAAKIKAQLENFQGTDDERKELENQMLSYEAEESANDKKQLPLKILGNSMFGSYGAPNVFPFGDNIAAEMTTCIGRQSLRLMISHFNKLGYTPIVGDSFTYDTPLFVRDLNGLIDIKQISSLIGNTEVDALGREYDYSDKNFEVLCRSGWMKPSYIYRHKTDKSIYEVSDGDTLIEVTEDHSLFNDNKEKIKPIDINKETKLEYSKYSDIHKDFNFLNIEKYWNVNNLSISKELLNATIDLKRDWYETFKLSSVLPKEYGTKEFQAKLMFIKKCLANA